MTGISMDSGGPRQENIADGAEARALWTRLRREEPVPVEPDPLELAAYADGRADRRARNRVEAYLARMPAALDWVLAARETASPRLAASGRPLSWGRVVNRGRALVSPVHAFRMQDAAQWSAVAASLLVVAILGFELGRGIDGSWMEQGSGVESPAIYGPIDSRDPLFNLTAAEEG